MNVIGLSGYARSGKDTVADILVRHHGYTRIAFADVMRDFMLAVDPYIAPMYRLSECITDVGWDEAKVTRPEVRRLLQAVGTDAGRKFLGEDVWVEATISKLDILKNYVISDCRFLNEAAAVKMLDGEVWRISRPGITQVNDHPSETSLDRYAFDWRINNDASIVCLDLKVNRIMTKGL